jgi:hypothetical protein
LFLAQYITLLIYVGRCVVTSCHGAVWLCFVGVLLPREELEAAAAMCAAAGTWLVLDNTYEDFLYEGRSHHTVSGPNVISVFSFSKAYGEGNSRS